MTTDLSHLPENPFETGNLVYVRALQLDELHDILEDEDIEKIAHPENLFSVHNADGERIAIIEGRDSAFDAARAYEMEPMSRH